MNKQELVEVVDHANTSWGQYPFKEDLQKQRKAWWRYLHDLDYGAVMATIDSYAVAGTQFLPRPGEIRQRTMVGRIPTALEAWAELQSAREAVYGGRLATPLSPMTQTVVKRLGEQAKGMHTNGDRDKFEQTYTSVVQEWLETECALTPIT